MVPRLTAWVGLTAVIILAHKPHWESGNPQATPRHFLSELSNIGRQFIPSEPIIIFAVLQVAGHPAKKPSVWIKRVEFVRRYQKIKEFWLPLKAESITQVRIFGKNILAIDWLCCTNLSEELQMQ